MITLCTTSDNKLIRTDVFSHSFENGDNAAIAATLTRISHEHKVGLVKLWVIFESGIDDEGELIMMSAVDFMFIYRIQFNAMIIQEPFTPSSIIRMTSTEGVIRVWWVDPKKQQDAVAIATWDNGWVLTAPQHKWLWKCIEMNMKDWLLSSFKKLRQNGQQVY